MERLELYSIYQYTFPAAGGLMSYGSDIVVVSFLSELRDSGRDTEAAERLLLVFERTQKVFEYDLADLEKRG